MGHSGLPQAAYETTKRPTIGGLRAEGDFGREYDHLVHGESAHFAWLNRDGGSICLDPRAEDDKRILEAMLEKADVFVQNPAPGAIDRLGFATDRLRQEYPKLPCTFLAPDIQRRIMVGDHPANWCVEPVRKRGIPLSWDAQRARVSRRADGREHHLGDRQAMI